MAFVSFVVSLMVHFAFVDMKYKAKAQQVDHHIVLADGEWL